MLTRTVTTDEPQALELALQTLRRGGMVVFPTDTLYGLSCDPTNPAALNAIYTAKNRPTLKAIPVLIGETTQLQELVAALPPQAERLIQSYWPGPLTLVLPKNPSLPPELTPYPGLACALTIPSRSRCCALLVLGITSANIERENPGCRGGAAGGGGPHPDGGKLSGGTGSTIIDCMGAEPKLLRGSIAFEDILALWAAE